MGWLFTQNASRKDIIEGLVKFEENEAGIWNTLRHCTRGNVLWSLIEWTDKKSGVTRTIIGCHLLQRTVEQYGDRKVVSWGYKPLDEGMHPHYYTCPLGYLDQAPVACEEWRKAVHKYHRKYRIGDRLTLKHCKIPYLDVVTLKPLSGLYNGTRYRIPRDLVADVRPA